MYRDRIELYKEMERRRGSKLLVYVTGDRPGLETKIAHDAYDLFVNQLESIGECDKISLYLITRGGEVLAAWSIVNLLYQYCKNLEIIVPSRCHSSGTLICLGAQKIVMTKSATLGPIDPSITHPLNPQIPGAPPEAKISVSVESIEGYIQMIKEKFGQNAENDEALIEMLSEKVHPLVLGQVYRTKGQIKMLAEKLLRKNTNDKANIDKIVSFLCSESGSHDYTIHRKEAQEELGMPVESPDKELEVLINNIYEDIKHELELGKILNPNEYFISGDFVEYNFKRGILESIDGGADYFSAEGFFQRRQMQTPHGMQSGINEQRNFEGWRHEKY